MKYKPTIGLEIHFEAKTKTKMFCDCLNSFSNDTRINSNESRIVNSQFDKNSSSLEENSREPNINICPVCTGHPGTLPVINFEAVKSVLKLGMALHSEIPKESKFDRKNYFYPDLPKGYQISQYDKPLCLGGELNGVKIRRIHLEEDTGRLVHDINGKPQKDFSFVDFNRAGVPLVELVTEPDIKNGKEAIEFAKELQLILRYLGISDADMEKGQLRVEVNISLKSENSSGFGTKVEIKNLNSFKAVGDSIDYEIKRQAETLENNEKIIQETRGWDDTNRKTVSQRSKEEAHDYRYFPEPDLPPMDLTKINLEEIKISVPELPKEKRKRFVKEYGLEEKQIDILVSDRDLAQYFEEAGSELKIQNQNFKFQILFNYLTSDLIGLMNEKNIGLTEIKITPRALADLVSRIMKAEISSRIAKDVLREMFETGLDSHQIIKDKNLAQVSDSESIKKVVLEIIAENPSAVSDYKKGKANSLQFMIGQAMKKMKGQGNPEVLRKEFEKALI